MRAHPPITISSVALPTRYNFVNLTGRRFDKLTVIEFAGKHLGRTYWRCICECGGESVVLGGNLGRGHTTSCGCVQSKVMVCRNADMATHGESSPPTPEFKTWDSMLQRCYNEKTKGYERYGGAGVTVCERWRRSYEAFLSDIGRRPSNKHSIDRWPDPWGNYEPGNCRWATAYEQRHNWRKDHPRKSENANV